MVLDPLSSSANSAGDTMTATAGDSDQVSSSAGGSAAKSSVGAGRASGSDPSASRLSGVAGSPAADNSPKWLGKRIGRFRLIGVIGKGAMGKVFRAEDIHLHRLVAVLVLRTLLL